MKIFNKIALKKIFITALAGAPLLLLSACGTIRFEEYVPGATETSSPQTSKKWNQDGMIAMSRPLPSINSTSSLTGLGFIPSAKGSWLAIDRGTGEVQLMEEKKSISSAFGVGANRLQPGTYEIQHKQRNAPWYAPDAYYKARGLPVPPEGDKTRYMRGALGEFVLYIDKSTPIHSGPIWNPEIGGVKVDEITLAKIYYSLEVGDTIRVE